MQVTDVDVAKAIIAHEAVDCFIGQEENTTEQPKNPVSCIGGNFWGLTGETWPVAENRTPLFPWLQIVCTDIQNLYRPFFKKQAVSFFLNPEIDGFEAVSRNDHRSFVVREYAVGSTLVPLPRPKSLTAHPFHRINWQSVKDYPSVSKYHGLFEGGVYKSICQIEQFEYENRYGIKIRGWPTPVQTFQCYPGEWDLQIDMTSNYSYADSGIAYLRKNGKHWYVQFECC